MNRDTNFDVEDFCTEIEEIKINIKRLFEIEGSLSEKRQEHRKFAKKINIDFNTVEGAYKLYRPSSIIKIYTFVENLVKTYVYSILGNGHNDAITQFIKNKLPTERFVPGTKIDEIKKIIKEFTPNAKELKLFVKIFGYNDSIRTFDTCINNRHEYAHRGNLPANYTEQDYKEIINVLYYLVDELYFCLSNITVRIKFQNKILEIKNTLLKLLNEIEVSNRRGFNGVSKKIKSDANLCIKLLKSLGSSTFAFKSDIYIKIEEDLKILILLDLRKNTCYNKNYITSNLKIFYNI